MDKEQANKTALVIAVVGSLIIVSVIEYLAYRVFGRPGVLIVSAMSMLVIILMKRANQ